MTPDPSKSAETEVRKVLRHHGWVRTKGAGVPSGDSVHSHPNHPGHVIRVDNRGGWWHADGNRKWAAVIHKAQERHVKPHHPIEHVVSGRPDQALHDHLTKFHAQGAYWQT